MNTHLQYPSRFGLTPADGNPKAGPLGWLLQRLLPLLCTVLLLGGAATASYGQSTDFRQFANEPGNEAWINSILQQNNSVYYEGTSTLQRLVLVGIPTTSGNHHVLHFSHQATKGGIHAYDFVTGYDQALADYNTITGGPFTALSVAGNALGPQATAAMVNALYNSNLAGPNKMVAANAVAASYSSLPNAPAGNVAAKVAVYDGASTSKRGVQIYGSSPVTNAHLDLVSYSGGSDIYADYDLHWDSASPNVLILMGGHLSVSGTGAAGTLSYGPGLGSGSISGGPYHFKLDNVDGITLGSQDNQIKGTDILMPPAPSCAISGPATICSGSTATFTGPAGMDSYTWTLLNNTSGSSFTTATNLPSVSVLAGGTSGSYTVKLVTTRLGVTSTDVCQKIVNVNKVSLAATTVNVACFGGNTGSISLTASGGTAPYTYDWGGGITSQNRTGLAAGTYSVTVTDAIGCSAFASYTITQPASGLTASAAKTDVSCNGGTDGTITLTVAGGTAPYTYLWNGGATSQNRTGLGAGTYNVTVTDANGCTATASATIAQPALLTASAAKTDVSCFGYATGTITLTVAGGTAPYTYLWNGGATTQNRTGLAAGTYNVTVTDAKGCTATASATISQPMLLTASAVKTDVNCFGGTNGTITLTVAGGTSPYTYLWNGGATTQNRVGLGAGTYNVTVTDANGCTATASATIAQPAAALSASAAKTDVSCNGGSNGTITLTVTGGTSPYTYLWNGGVTSQNRSGLAAGTYNVTVTDANGCTTTASATIGQPALLTASAAKTDVSCYNGTNGTITLTVTGGTAPYTYLWNGGATSQNRNNLSAGTYNVTVTDANGCTATASATIGQPALLTASAAKTDVSCFNGTNGTITLTVAGGTAPYTYLWNGGATSQNRTGLAAGTYNVTVTDSKGCTATASATISQPVLLTASAAKTDVSCYNGTNGTITLTVAGGTAPYTYLWNGGVTSQNRSGLAAGTYNVTVTDANGCTATASATIVQPAAALSASAAKTDVSCYNGSNGTITLTVTGGTAPYTYAWNGGVTTQNRTGLAAGTYNVTVTDANGCTATASATIGQPALLTASAAKTDVSCNGGSNGTITLTVVGGTSPYTYLWNGGATSQNRSGLAAGTYNVTVTDANGCTATASATVGQPALLTASAAKTDVSCNGGSNGTITLTVAGGTAPYTYLWNGGATTQNRSGLAAGTYNVTVTDSKGCTATASATIGQPALLTASAAKTDVSCYNGTNGTITLTVTGGTAPYTYLWNGGATSQNRSGLAAGTYNVTVTDANGCTATASATIGQPALLTATAAKTDVSCYNGTNGTITLTVTGGTAPYTYLWNGGATSQNRSGLATGTYNVTVTDSKGCTATASATIGQPMLLTASAAKTDVSCNGGSNGTITLTVTGGTTPYTYAWNSGATTQNLASLPAGTYNVTVTDANGCTATASATVGQPALLTASAAKTDVSCFDGTNGTITLTVTGGTMPYSYLWNGGATSQNRTGLGAGTYSVTVTDAKGCTATASATIGQPELLTASAVSTNETCAKTDGTATATVAGGTAPYSYAWRLTGQPAVVSTTRVATGLVAGDYTVTVTDFNSCSTTAATKVVADNCLVQHCTLTQGGYGNGNGVICKYPGVRRTQLITNLLSSGGDLTLGVSGRSITFSAATASSAAQCIIDAMPAGGSAAALPSIGNASGCSLPGSVLKNGRFNNVLIGQTLALSLNTRLDNTLADVPLSAVMTSYNALSCSGPDPLDLTGMTKNIPASVMGNLSHMGATPTVGSLLTLANKALGGASYANAGGNPSFSEISGAAGAINELFDNCRMFLNTTSAQLRVALTPTTSPSVEATSNLHAYPNPFAATTTLEFTLPQATHYSLVVYDVKGSVVATVGSGVAEAGVRYSFPLGGALQEGIYLARLVTDKTTQTIRLNLIK
ncbi:T9SS type A sorting domain-containing protein [Hymenobacter properus]|uniref:T9SS type A sorting domain-containing protein n=1 Tax=Hymenobacter properus TaxID=2791026 RepID=A0A931FIL3_9BACT|nr:T9SS type A sorting domain-containing protein [Hymenobacter properus]MBF9140923.1 T9SS type A sorting domain-containing protein [Hymenobacter properus]MBR7719732.1 T9SS type A sorting domain-containing protein [Microvirga sp. SRT04]